MKRVIGFACFMIAAGLILSMFLPGLIWDICITAVFLVLGYVFFCC